MSKRITAFALAILFLFLAVSAAAGFRAAPPASASERVLTDLLPQVEGWTMPEAPRKYSPGTLFEYIDGAAESYVGYDVVEVAVGDFQRTGGSATLTADIYDMGSPANAFGIYASERFPESAFQPFGVQGYIEEGSLNFLAGRYYVKLLAFETGEQTESVLRAFAADILARIGDPGGFPAVFQAFPPAGRAAHTERFILKSVLGLEFLKNGYFVVYKLKGEEMEAFAMECASADEAVSLLDRYLSSQDPLPAAEKKGELLHRRDRYLAHVFVGRSGRYLAGVIKVKDAALAEGEKLALELAANLKNR